MHDPNFEWAPSIASPAEAVYQVDRPVLHFHWPLGFPKPIQLRPAGPAFYEVPPASAGSQLLSMVIPRCEAATCEGQVSEVEQG